MRKVFQPEQTADDLVNRYPGFPMPWLREAWKLWTHRRIQPSWFPPLHWWLFPPPEAQAALRPWEITGNISGAENSQMKWSLRLSFYLKFLDLMLLSLCHFSRGGQNRSTRHCCRPPGAGKLGQSSAAVTRWGIKAPSSGRGVVRRWECYI